MFKEKPLNLVDLPHQPPPEAPGPETQQQRLKVRGDPVHELADHSLQSLLYMTELTPLVFVGMGQKEERHAWWCSGVTPGSVLWIKPVSTGKSNALLPIVHPMKGFFLLMERWLSLEFSKEVHQFTPCAHPLEPKRFGRSSKSESIPTWNTLDRWFTN